MPPRAGTKRRADNDAEDEERQERQNAVLSRVQALDRTAAEAFLETLAGRWHLDSGAPGSFDEIFQRSMRIFGVESSATLNVADVGSFGIRQLDDRIHDHEIEVISLYHRLRETGGLDDVPRLNRMVKVIEQIFYAKRLVLSAFQGSLSVHQTQCEDLVLDADIDARLGSWSLRFRWIDDDTNQVQRLLLFMLEQALQRRYRRHNGWCYEPIVVNGKATHAWKAVMEIRDWIYAETRKETNWEQWTWLTHGSQNVRTAVEYLSQCVDYNFPVLRKNRSVFAFPNGVYLAATDTFHDFATATEPLDESIVAAKYFPYEFASYPGRPWDAIPTPHMDTILDYQGFSKDVKRWMFILLGRLLYDLNDKDGWQVIPFLKGQASSGKSTVVLKVAKAFYESLDTGVMSNNAEKRFGLSAFHDKLLFVAPEIKQDLQIEQAEFQSMVSGEDVTINTKHKTAYSKEWKTPGILAGNEIPGWCDNSGSISRRLMLFDFSKSVTNGDMRLADRLSEEIGLILLKSNRAYLEAVAAWGGVNIWTVVPQYFKTQRQDLAQATNAVEAFIASGDLTVSPTAYVPFDEFKAALKEYAQSNNYRLGKLTWETFRGPFDRYGITKVKDAREYRGRRLTREYLNGVDVSNATAVNALM